MTLSMPLQFGSKPHRHDEEIAVRMHALMNTSTKFDRTGDNEVCVLSRAAMYTKLLDIPVFISLSHLLLGPLGVRADDILHLTLALRRLCIVLRLIVRVIRLHSAIRHECL